MGVRVETHRNGAGKPTEKRPLVAASADVIAGGRRLDLVEHHEVVPAGHLHGLGGRGLRLFVPVFSVDDRRVALPGVTRDVLPDVEHRTAGRVDQCAARL